MEKMTVDARRAWLKRTIEEAWARAQTGADLVLHGAAKALIDEGAADEELAHRCIGEAIINEVLDHGYAIVVDKDGTVRLVQKD